MEFSLLVVFIIVLVFWLVIMGIYLVVSRQQPSVSDDIRDLEKSIEDLSEK